MNSAPQGLLSKLLELTKIDGSLAQILAQRKSIEKELQLKSEQLRKIEVEVAAFVKAAGNKRDLCKQEEKNLAEERHRVTERRKALKGLGTYKLQQAAEREIDQTARELSSREDSLLKMISDAENIEKELNLKRQKLTALQQEFQVFQKDAEATLANGEVRAKDLQIARADLVPQFEPSAIAVYNKVRDKHPGQALAEAKNMSCGGCFMQIGPQIIVQIQRGQTLQRCPGCGRILYVTDSGSSKEE